MVTCSLHRRSRPAPVRSREEAITALSIATDDGRDPCLALACLDHERRPLTMFVIDGGRAADLGPALDILLQAVEGHDSPLDAVILGSSRPEGEAVVEAADREAWPDLVARAGEAGIVILDWFILADGEVASVAESVGSPPEW